jgi:hypothetical protein
MNLTLEPTTNWRTADRLIGKAGKIDWSHQPAGAVVWLAKVAGVSSGLLLTVPAGPAEVEVHIHWPGGGRPAVQALRLLFDQLQQGGVQRVFAQIPRRNRACLVLAFAAGMTLCRQTQQTNEVELCLSYQP